MDIMEIKVDKTDLMNMLKGTVPSDEIKTKDFVAMLGSQAGRQWIWDEERINELDETEIYYIYSTVRYNRV